MKRNGHYDIDHKSAGPGNYVATPAWVNKDDFSMCARVMGCRHFGIAVNDLGGSFSAFPGIAVVQALFTFHVYSREGLVCAHQHLHEFRHCL